MKNDKAHTYSALVKNGKLNIVVPMKHDKSAHGKNIAPYTITYSPRVPDNDLQ